MFLFCFIPSNKHGCLMYRSFMSLWITFVPPTASSIMSKLPEYFISLYLFMISSMPLHTEECMISWKKNNMVQIPTQEQLGSGCSELCPSEFFSRNLPGWRFYNLHGQLIPIFDCHHSEFFFLASSSDFPCRDSCPLWLVSYCSAPLRKAWLFLLCHYVAEDSNKMPPWISQPLFIRHVSQPPTTLMACWISVSFS